MSGWLADFLSGFAAAFGADDSARFGFFGVIGV
jgi:hypothetical protein